MLSHKISQLKGHPLVDKLILPDKVGWLRSEVLKTRAAHGYTPATSASPTLSMPPQRGSSLSIGSMDKFVWLLHCAAYFIEHQWLSAGRSPQAHGLPWSGWGTVRSSRRGIASKSEGLQLYSGRS